jgi:hypothetical protein
MYQKAWFAPIFFILWTACRSLHSSSTLEDSPTPSADRQAGYCAAIRGNGNFVFTHFGAVSRVLEEFGEIKGMAGGSSASITTFLYESMLLNPVLPPDGPERAQILALMMKSVFGFTLLLGDSEEALALQGLARIGQKVKDQGLLSLVTVNWIGAGLKLKKILEAPEVRDLVNPEALKMLANIDRAGFQDYKFKVSELIKAASAAGGFTANENGMFFREPVVNYEGFTANLGRLGNFYAGLDPDSNTDLMTFLKACQLKSPGHTWTQIAAENTGGTTCGALFAKALNTYRSRMLHRAFVPSASQDRLNQVIGKHLLTFVPSAILDGKNAVDIFEKSLATYRAGKPPALPVTFTDVKFGYFTPFPSGNTTLARMKQMFPSDAKVAKGVNLNTERPVTWREALRFSTIEPGLSRIIPVSSDRAYIGGWGDLHPTQILRAAGCEKIIYISRIGAETTFVTKQHSLANIAPDDRYGVAERLNMTEEEHRQLYDMTNKDNAFNNSVRTADAVWCTDWDSSLSNDVQFMFDHAYGLTPSTRGPNAGHTTGVAWRDPDRSDFPVLSSSVPTVKEPFWGCHAP